MDLKNTMFPLILFGMAPLVLGLGGCAETPPPRENYPDNPPPEDVLAKDPCSVKQEPEIAFAGSEISSDEQEAWKKIVQGDLQTIRKVNPVFLCGLNRIQFMDQISFEKEKSNPDTVAFYSEKKREIHIKRYSPEILYHELGHHLHNLGLVAPIVRDFRATAWLPKGDGDWQRRNDDSLFLTQYSKKSYLEDWAEHFAYLTAHPLEIGLSVAVPSPIDLQGRDLQEIDSFVAGEKDMVLALQHPETMQHRLELMTDKIDFPSVPLEKFSVHLAPSHPLPPADLLMMEGNTILSYKDRDKRWEETSLDNLEAGKKLESQAIPELKSIGWGKGEVYQKKTLGDLQVIVGRMNYFSSQSRGSGIGFLVWDKKNGSAKPFHPPGMQAILGEMQDMKGQLGFFNAIGETLSMQSFNPRDGSVTKLFSIALPRGFNALHVIPLPGNREYLVLGGRHGQETIEMLKVSPDAKDEKGFTVKSLDTINMPAWRESDLEVPALQGNHLILPLKTFQFLNFDLNSNRFSLIDPQFDRKPQEFVSLKKIVSQKDRLYVLGTGRNGESLISPIDFKKP